MTDLEQSLVDRLRDIDRFTTPKHCKAQRWVDIGFESDMHDKTLREAADTIESLQAENKTLLALVEVESERNGVLSVQVEAFMAERDRYREALVWIYNQGYQSGHHDTVEGQFTDIHPDDEDSYHKDVVDELMADR